jgi:hypothetical protein
MYALLRRRTTTEYHVFVEKLLLAFLSLGPSMGLRMITLPTRRLELPSRSLRSTILYCHSGHGSAWSASRHNVRIHIYGRYEVYVAYS